MTKGSRAVGLSPVFHQNHVQSPCVTTPVDHPREHVGATQQAAATAGIPGASNKVVLVLCSLQPQLQEVSLSFSCRSCRDQPTSLFSNRAPQGTLSCLQDARWPFEYKLMFSDLTGDRSASEGKRRVMLLHTQTSVEGFRV
jgi:hypothetical protein